MTFEDAIDQANESLTAMTKLWYNKLAGDDCTDECLEQAAKYEPTMASLLRRLNVKSLKLRATRAMKLQRVYEHEYEYYRAILYHSLEPHIRGKYLLMQQHTTAKIYGLLSIITAALPTISV